MKGDGMRTESEDDMRPEYDFSKATRNPYCQRFQDLNLVSLDSDVAASFPDSNAVNDALRLLIKTAASVTKKLPQAS